MTVSKLMNRLRLLANSKKRTVRRREEKRLCSGALEHLEVRQLLAAFSWNTDLDGDWHNASNWVDSNGNPGVPAFGDDVTIDRGAANPTITISSANARAATIMATEKIVINGFELLVDGGGSLGSVQLIAGELDLNAPSILSGDLDWSGGVLGVTDLTISASSTMTIDGASGKSFSGVINNLGSVVQSASISVAGTIHNRVDANWDLQADHGMAATLTFTFNNEGSFRKSTGAGESALPGRFNHRGGTVEVNSGRLTLPQSGSNINLNVSTGGAFVVAADAVLSLNSSGTSYYSGRYTGAGSGRVEWAGGTLDARSTGGVVLDFPEGMFHWTGGTIFTAGIGGDAFVNEGHMSWSGSAGYQLLGAVFRNRGTVIQLDDGNGLFSSGGQGTWFHNESGAVFESRGAGGIIGGTVFNGGTFRKVAGDSSFETNLNMMAGSVMEVTGGAARFLRGGDFETSEFKVSSGGVIELRGSSNFQIVSGATISGSGDGRIDFTQGVIESVGSDAVLDFAGGLFHWSGGAFFRDITNAGDITITAGGGQAFTVSSIFTNTGAVTQLPGSVLAIADVVNAEGALWLLQDDAGMVGFNGLVTNDFRNFGTLRKTEPGASAIEGTGAALSHRGGVLEVLDGSLTALHTGNSPGTGGHFQVVAGSTFEITGDLESTGTYTGSGEGHIAINAEISGGATVNFPEGMATLAIPNADDVHSAVNDGWLTIDGQGQRQEFGWFTNNGTVVMTPGTEIEMRNYSLVVNRGTWEMQGDASISFHAFDGLAAYFINLGTIRKAGAVGASSISGGGNNAVFTNNGLVEVLSGSLQIHERNLKQYDLNSRTLHASDWYVGPFSTLSIIQTNLFEPAVNTSYASITLDGDASSFPNIDALQVNGGALTITNGRDLTTDGDLTNGVELVSSQLTDVRPIAGGRFVGVAVGDDFIVTHPRNDRVNGDPVFYVRDKVSGEFLRTITQPGGAVNVSGLDVTTSELNVGGTLVPAGTLLFIHANEAPATLYAIDPADGQVLSFEHLVDVGTNQTGVAQHPRRNTVFVVGQNSVVTEVDPSNGSTINSFPVRPAGSPFFSMGSWGGMDVDSDGNLLLIGSSQRRVRVLSPAGEFITDVDLTYAGMSRETPSDISYDDVSGEVQVASENGYLFQFTPAVAGVQGHLQMGPSSTLNVANLVSQPGSRIGVAIGGRPASEEFGSLAVVGTSNFSQIELSLADAFGPTSGDVYNVISYDSRSGDLPVFLGLDPFFSADVSANGVSLTAEVSAVNLFVDADSITAPVSASPGDLVDISYTVHNSSTTALSDEWDDSIYLSVDQTFDSKDVLIGRVARTEGLAGLASYTATLTARMPGVPDGDYHVIVVADSKRRIPETNRNDNVVASVSGLASTVPMIALAQTISATIVDGQNLYLKLQVPPGRGDVVINTLLQQLYQADVFVRFNDLPTRTSFDFAAVQALETDRTITLPAARAGAWYILIQGREGASVPAGFELSTARIEFAVSSLTPSQGSNLGRVTSQVQGSGFNAETNVSLIDASGSVVATASKGQVTPNLIHATFDLTSVPAGVYDVRVSDGTRSEILSDAYEVVPGIPGFLRTTLTLPGLTRSGREYAAILEYTNAGDTDLLSPIITVTADTDIKFSEVSDQFVRETRFLATSEVGPAGVLAPGETVQIPFRFIGGSVRVNSFILSVEAASVMDWEELRSAIRPEEAESIWETVFAETFASAGTTVGDYVNLLANAATRHATATGDFSRHLPELIEFLVSEAVATRQASVTAMLSLDEPGRPAGAVLVEATETTTGETYLATSWANGLLQMPLPPGEYRLAFNGVLAPVGTSRLTVPEGGIAEPFDWLVQTGASIIGRAALEDRVLVPDPDGGFVPSVTARNTDGQFFTAELDAGGRYEFRGLPDGIYEVQFETVDTVPARVEGIQAVSDESVNVPDLISIYGGSIMGRTINPVSGLPVIGATVVAEAADGTSRSAESDENGNYLIIGVSPGLVTVSARTADSPRGIVEGVSVTKDQATTGVDLGIDPAALGRMVGTVSANGLPAAGAGVDLIQAGTVIASATVAADGTFTIAAVPPGDYDINITSDQAVTLSERVTIVADQVTPGSFVLSTASVLRGVITQTGVEAVNPVEGLSLLLLTPSNESLLILTGDGGQFAVEELVPGDYTLMLPDGAYRHEFTVGLTAETVTIDFEIAAGAVLGTVMDSTGLSGLPDITVSLIVNEQVVATTSTISNGQFVFPFVSPGEYELRFSSQQYLFPNATSVQLSSGSFIEVNASAAAESLTISLIEDGTGNLSETPFGVVIVPADELGIQMRTVLVENGQFTFENLTTGQYKVIADDGIRGYQWLVDVLPGSNSASLTLENLTEISGVLTDAAGAPVADMLVVVTEVAGQFRWDTRTDQDGNYSILLPPGQYVATAAEGDVASDLNGVLPSTSFSVTASNATQNLQLTAGVFVLDGQLLSNTGTESTAAGALVVLLNDRGIAIRAAEADFDGVFRFENLPAGQYSISASADGFQFETLNLNLAASDSVVVSGTWHSPDIGTHVTRPDSSSGFNGFLADGGDDEDTVAAWIRNGIAGLRRKIEEALRVPREKPRLIQAPRIPAGLCGGAADAAKAAIKRALAMQRAADGFFDAWTTQYIGAQEKLLANVGLFGINLLQFSTDLYFQTPKIKQLVNSADLARFDNISDSISSARGFIGAETKSWAQLLSQANVEDNVLPLLQKQLFEITETLAFKSDMFDAAIQSAGAGTAFVTSGVTELNGPTTLAGVKNALQGFGADPSLASVSNLVSSVTGFAGRVLTHANTLAALIPRLEAAIQKLPPAAAAPVQKLVSSLGVMAGALNTISAATQGIGDIMDDVKRIDDLEAQYENALKRRDEALREAERIMANAAKTGEGDCPDPPPPPPGPPGGSGGSSRAGSFDPNDIVGPAGSGEEHFVRSEITFPYTIRFENIADATAPAQEVLVTQQLPAELDWSTFEIGSFGWGDKVFEVPEGLNFYETRIDVTDSLGYFVDFRAEVDLITGLASWFFTSTDPETGDLIAEVLAGFLPPNGASPEGEGFVEYTIRPKSDIPDASRIDALAEIIFDLNDPIVTPVYSNTIDDSVPVSQVNLLPEFSDTAIEVSWSSDDGAGSGVATYDIFVAENGGPYTLWLDDTTASSGVYPGLVGHTYQFYSVATDNVAFEEPAPSTADTSTTVRMQFLTPEPFTSDVGPTFSWAPAADAVAYDVWVDNRGTKQSQVLLQRVTESSFTPESPLGIGLFRAWVRVVRANGSVSEWSPYHDFRVSPRVDLTPLDRNQLTSSPVVSWNAVPGAARYDLWIDNRSTGQMQFVRDMHITETSWTPSADLPLGTYRIWVRAFDEANFAASWSFAQQITLRTPPVVLEPVLATFNRTPEFRFEPVEGAAHYSLIMRHAWTGQNVFSVDNVTTTSFTPSEPIPDGPHRWWVRAVSAEGVFGYWSAATDIWIGGRVTSMTPTVDTNGVVTFEWNAVDGAVRYDLWVNQIGGTSQIIREEHLTGTSYTAPQPLGPGTYRIWMFAISITGEVAPVSRAVDVVIAQQGDPEHEDGLLLTAIELLPETIGESAVEPVESFRTVKSPADFCKGCQPESEFIRVEVAAAEGDVERSGQAVVDDSLATPGASFGRVEASINATADDSTIDFLMSEWMATGGYLDGSDAAIRKGFGWQRTSVRQTLAPLAE